MKLDNFLCFLFLVRCFGPGHAQTAPFFPKIVKLKFRLIYSKFSCEPRTKDCAWSRSSLHEERCLKFPEFHKKTIDMNYVEN